MTDIHALAGAYALDAVDDLERTAFERHLRECETCAADLAELRETTARLADGTWSAPPPRLREQVLAQVSRTRQLPPGRPPRPRAAAAGARPVRRWLVAAAAAVVLVAGAGVAGYVLQEQRVRDAEQTAEQAEQRAAEIQALLAAPDARLRGGAVTGGGRLTVVTSASLDTGMVLLAGARPPGADQAYQLWLIDDAGPVSAGVLPAGTAGDTVLVPAVGDAEQVGLTLEPAGGSTTPTEPILAAVPVT
jgi:anti-sigma-K factor RskA